VTHIKMSVFQIYNNNNKYMTSWHKTTTTATFLVNTYRHKTTTPDLYLLNTRQTHDYKTTTTSRLQDNNNSSRDLSNSSTMVNTRQTQYYNTLSPYRNTHLSQSSTLVTSPTAAQWSTLWWIQYLHYKIRNSMSWTRSIYTNFEPF